MPPKCPSRRKVKSGCLTCKARKVKCDELKPVCTRCQKTGRVCDGYGIWGGGGNGYAERYSSKVPQNRTIITSPIPKASISREETQHIHWFQNQIVHNMASYFCTAFWTDLVLPAAFAEPAVAHAVVALSAAYKNDISRRHDLSDIQERFVLLQYNKAIHHVQTLFTNGARSSILTVLITCLLFTSIEYLRGQYKAASFHLRNGLNLLRDSYSDRTLCVSDVRIVKLGPERQGPNLSIFKTFAALHVQAKLFDHRFSDGAMILQATETEIPSPVFVSVQEAMTSLEKLLHGIILMSQRVRAKTGRTGAASSSLIQAPEIAMDHLLMWQTSYKKTVWSKEDSLVCMLLLNYHTMATLMCQCLRTRSELIYEAYTEEFVTIISRSIQLWEVFGANEDVGRQGALTGMGWIPPLYFTALKCRISRIRRHAIRLLRTFSRREGIWDSVLAANVAEQVIWLEERDLERHSEDEFIWDKVLCKSQLDQGSEYVLDRRTVDEVQVELLEMGNVVLTCSYWQEAENDVITQWKFNGQQWDYLGYTTMAT